MHFGEQLRQLRQLRAAESVARNVFKRTGDVYRVPLQCMRILQSTALQGIQGIHRIQTATHGNLKQFMYSIKLTLNPLNVRGLTKNL